jgi:hypothetical protein
MAIASKAAKSKGKGKARSSRSIKATAKADTRYDLHYLVDRKGHGDSTMYQVLWFAPNGHGRCPRTWEAKADLLLDDPSLQDEMDVVDRWIATGQSTSFHKFMQGDEFGKALLTANDDESCAFVAVRTAAALVGVPSIYSESEYERFVQDSSDPRHDASVGISPKALLAFVARLCNLGAPLDFKVFQDNRHKTGHLHTDAIYRLSLDDGIYIVGAKKLDGVAHAFAMTVADGVHVVHDDGVVQLLGEYGKWIVRVLFVRKFQLAIAY